MTACQSPLIRLMWCGGAASRETSFQINSMALSFQSARSLGRSLRLGNQHSGTIRTVITIALARDAKSKAGTIAGTEGSFEKGMGRTLTRLGPQH